MVIGAADAGLGVLGVLSHAERIVEEDDRAGAGGDGVAELGAEVGGARTAAAGGARGGSFLRLFVNLAGVASHDDHDLAFDVDALEVAEVVFVEAVAGEDEVAADLAAAAEGAGDEVDVCA